MKLNEIYMYINHPNIWYGKILVIKNGQDCVLKIIYSNNKSKAEKGQTLNFNIWTLNNLVGPEKRKLIKGAFFEK